MKVSRITISNILGIEHLEIEPGRCTVITGQNGTGKTSVIEALKSLVRGGHDATLLRNGEQVGEVVLLMEDGMTIRKRVTEGGSKLTAHHPSYGPLRAAQTWLRGATDQFTVNPVQFLTDPKRAERLLEAIPMDPDLDTLDDMLRTVGLSLPAGIESMHHALPAIAAVRRTVYDERTGVNRVKRDAHGSVRQLRESLPDAPPATEADVVELQAEMEQLTRRQTEALHRIDLQQQSRLADIDTETAEAKAQLAVQFNAAMNAIKETEAEAKKTVMDECATARVSVQREHGNVIAETQTRLDTAKESARHARAYANTKALIDEYATKAKEADSNSAMLTDVIRSLDTMCAQKSEALPISGLTIDNGEIHVDGIPFVRLNKAKQVELAVEVAKLRTGEIPLVCLDGLENLDSERFALLTEGLAKADMQAIVTMVTDDDKLTVSGGGK